MSSMAWGRDHRADPTDNVGHAWRGGADTGSKSVPRAEFANAATSANPGAAAQ
jgi:hypothetical protein